MMESVFIGVFCAQSGVDLIAGSELGGPIGRRRRLASDGDIAQKKDRCLGPDAKICATILAIAEGCIVFGVENGLAPGARAGKSFGSVRFTIDRIGGGG